MTSTIPEKFQRRIALIEDAIQSISKTVERSDLRSYLRDYREERQTLHDHVRTNVILIEAALRELKDLLEDNIQQESKR